MPLDQRIIDLYDEYTHEGLGRRVFLERAAKITGSVAAATAAFDMLAPNYALAQMVKPDDGRLESKMVTYQGADLMTGYLVRPKGTAKLPGVLVIHENRGLNPHIQDIARRMALEGFTVLAPDALSPVGGAPADQDAAIKMIGEVSKDMPKVVRNFAAGVDYLKKSDQTTGKVGVVGFCWGGAMSAMMAVNSSADAVSVFYGRAPNAPDADKVKAPLIVNLGALDTGLNASWPPFEAAMKAQNKKINVYSYEGANHAFNNDTGGERYNKAAADQAWARTVALFKENLKG
jgi:carboxymethylenebutenolidase